MKERINGKIEELLSAEEFNDLDEIVKLGEKATRGLVNILSKESDPLMRKRAAIALGRIRDKKAIEPLVNRLMDKDPTVLISIIDALALMGQKSYSDKIIPFLDNPDASVRGHAAKALGVIKARNAKKAIEGLLRKEEYEFVRKEANDALKKLGY